MGLGALVAYMTVNKTDRRKVITGYQAGRATFSRAYESEADVLGSIYAYRAGYSPRGLATFFDHQSSGINVSPWLIDHPFDSQRKARVLGVADHLTDGKSTSDLISIAVLKTLQDVENAH
jgi:predicted Zn-dependent protease